MKIGFLLPRSVLYPSISFDIVDGFKASLKKAGAESKYEIVSESIGIAGKDEDIYAKAEKLLLQGADIVVGYINPASAEFIHPLFENSGRQLLVLDSGYHFPAFKEKLSNTWFISLQGNLLCRAIIRKAIEDDNNTKFAFTCSFYDAGYRPSYTFSAAAEQKGAAVVYNHVTQLNRADFTLDPLSGYLTNNDDTALLISFCGDMAEDFFREASKSDAIRNTKIYGSGFTADEGWLDKIPYPGFDWECAVAWCKNITTPENEEFTTALEGIKSGKANLFSLLGWEAAQFITAAGGGEPDGIIIQSPRGEVCMDAESGFTEAPVYYATAVKNFQTGNCSLKGVKKVISLETERKRLRNDIALLQNITVNSWLNAYACLDS
jgi:branched-chain amino acid transport system substrate-binding protein